MGNSWLEKKTAKFKDDVDFQTDRLLISASERLAQEIAAAGTNRAEIARKLGINRSAVTRALRGDRNLSIRTLVAIASAIGRGVEITFSQRADETHMHAAAPTEAVDQVSDALNKWLNTFEARASSKVVTNEYSTAP